MVKKKKKNYLFKCALIYVRDNRVDFDPNPIEIL